MLDIKSPSSGTGAIGDMPWTPIVIAAATAVEPIWIGTLAALSGTPTVTETDVAQIQRLIQAEVELDAGLGRPLSEVLDELRARHLPNGD